MKGFFQIRNKFKICCVLIVIIVLVLLNNLRSRKNISRLDESVSSIYQDRLLPATYLYEISNRLYQKRLMLEEKAGLPEDWMALKKARDGEIDSLVQAYDSTYLTKNEQTLWLRFKEQLQRYNRLESASFTLATGPGGLSVDGEVSLDEGFRQTVTLLNNLTEIQVGEGKNLQTGSHNIASGSVLSSHLEMTLLIVLGVMAVILLSMSDKHILNPDQKPGLN
ncbi:MCP four helix bundle domain-containing protein [Chitinophaga cymbidii]|nr:MCP four helix bundle domain-containing protein [Chitinophaga cymbidii]